MPGKHFAFERTYIAKQTVWVTAGSAAEARTALLTGGENHIEAGDIDYDLRSLKRLPVFDVAIKTPTPRRTE